MKERPRPLWISLGLVAVVLAVFGQTLRFDFTNYDDPDYVTNNPYVTGPVTVDSLHWAMTTGYAANWHPLTWMSHMLDYRLFGLNGGLHHLASVLLHVFSSLLLFAALRRMTGATWCAAAVAAFFAIHPLRAESVAWIAERKDTLSTFFWTLTMLLYARYVKRPGVMRYLPVVIGFGLGLMAKSMLVTLPFALLLLDFWPLRRIDRNNAFVRIAEKIPMIAMAAVVSVINYNVQQQGGAVISLSTIPLALRAQNAIISYAAYLWMLVWPAGLAPIYPFPPTIPFWQPLVAGIVLLVISWFAFSRYRSQPYLTIGWLWYLGTLVPVLGLVQVGEQARADRYTYIPSIGILFMLAWGVADLRKSFPRLRQPATLAAIAAWSACIVLTAIQVSYWQNTFALFSHAASATANNYKAYNALGALMLSQDKPTDAVSYLTKALEYNPRSIEARINMGTALDDLGRSPEALAHFKEAAQMDPRNADAQAGLGVALAETGSAEQGLAYVREAVRLHPGSGYNFFQLGTVYGILEKMTEAEQAFRESVRLDPSAPRSHFNLGLALGRQGKLQEAVRELREATRLKPDYANAWFNLGNAFAQEGLLQEAVGAFSEAVRLQPDFGDAREALSGAEEILRNGPH